MNKSDIDADIKSLFGGIFAGKRVLITGHSGFKGSWLSTWLIELGAEVIGYSIDIPTRPSFFKAAKLENSIVHIQGDVRNFNKLKQVFNKYSPTVVIHLAAQAITRVAYDIPRQTFYTNIVGTINILECLRNSTSVKAAVIITSDKCYYNAEWEWGYRETDRLGGRDPYSASKSCAEIVTHSYMNSFFVKREYPKVCTARAGNVIGGGDWAKYRVIPDCVRAWRNKDNLQLRYPNATRPWLFVLEPLSGYLFLAAHLMKGNKHVANESFNFGPDSKYLKPVKELTSLLFKIWGLEVKRKYIKRPAYDKRESTFLKLCSDKVLSRLGWHSTLTLEESVKLTAEWYKNYYDNKKSDVYEYSCRQIKYYIQKAKQQNITWVNYK